MQMSVEEAPNVPLSRADLGSMAFFARHALRAKPLARSALPTLPELRWITSASKADHAQDRVRGAGKPHAKSAGDLNQLKRIRSECYLIE
eukprot:scaffold2114_cov253-Pinguiococcus_pyrenoidosus.AAC.28